ncbi:MAG: hypothetical protein WAT92_04410 [Saprospiraceae bacterium]
MLKFICTTMLIGLISITSCSQSKEKSILAGVWLTQSLEGKLRFNDNRESIAPLSPGKGDFFTFEPTKINNKSEEESFKTLQYGMEEHGKYELDKNTNVLTINYLSIENGYVLYRKVENITNEKLVLTCDDVLIKRWLKTNKLMEDTPIKIVGGSFLETYKKSL